MAESKEETVPSRSLRSNTELKPEGSTESDMFASIIDGSTRQALTDPGIPTQNKPPQSGKIKPSVRRLAMTPLLKEDLTSLRIGSEGGVLPKTFLTPQREETCLSILDVHIMFVAFTKPIKTEPSGRGLRVVLCKRRSVEGSRMTESDGNRVTESASEKRQEPNKPDQRTTFSCL